jgi:hypothetical protein
MLPTQQVRQGGVGGVHQTLLIDRDHPLPFLGVGNVDGAQEHEAGIVDEDVETAKPVDDRLYSGFRLPAVGDVGLDGQGGAAGGLDLVHQGVEPVLAARENGDRCSVFGQCASGCLPDAAARAGDDGDRSVEGGDVQLIPFSDLAESMLRWVCEELPALRRGTV